MPYLAHPEKARKIFTHIIKYFEYTPFLALRAINGR
jgi:hypothetical protein